MILVTGGAGYIGSVVVEKLMAEGMNVIVVDNLSTGHLDAVDAPFFQGDYGDIDFMRFVFDSNKIDLVIHIGGTAVMSAGAKECFENNIRNTINLFYVMEQYGCKKLHFSSTGAINSDTAYSVSKRTIEQILPFYGFEALVLRYFNVAGATLNHGERHSPETHLIPSLIDASINGTLFHQFGNDVRDYVHVSDVAESHFNSIKLGTTGRYDVGSGIGRRTSEIIEIVEEIIGTKIHTKIQNRRNGLKRLVANFIWTPKKGIYDIVESAFKWRLKCLNT